MQIFQWKFQQGNLSEEPDTCCKLGKQPAIPKICLEASSSLSCQMVFFSSVSTYKIQTLPMKIGDRYSDAGKNSNSLRANLAIVPFSWICLLKLHNPLHEARDCGGPLICTSSFAFPEFTSISIQKNFIAQIFWIALLTASCVHSCGLGSCQ